jgi:hypothetical protein
MKHLSLKHFILRQRVLDLYRYAIRSSRGEQIQTLLFTIADLFMTGIPDPTARKETVAWLRSEFERNRNIEDLVWISGHVR